ncbi:MAG TPA: helix-turn-helix transcriptional regulator [Steroidobacteraceae bacterium]|nr:helix-turn-helix transcriptional regulator [Steroidobacteraceae bacterium]
MSSLGYDFDKLIAIMRERAQKTGDPGENVMANLASALKGFLTERRIAPSEVIGATLRNMFFRHVSRHLETLRANGADARYLANRKSGLTRWRRLLAELDRLEAAVAGADAPFAQALNDICAAGVTRKGLARAIGMPLATLKRWEDGATPTRRSIHYVDRIERFLGMTPGQLRGLLKPLETAPDVADCASVGSCEERKDPKKDPYQLQPRDAMAPFQQQWQGLGSYKSQSYAWEEATSIPDDIEEIGKPWRMFEMPPGKKVRYPWISVIGDKRCGAAEHAYPIAAAYIGWMQLSPEKGGLGMTPADAQNLARFADPQKIKAYVLWRKKERSNGRYTRTTIRFLAFAGMLCRAETGFLYRHPEMGQSMGILDEEKWRKRCTQTLNLVNVIRRDIKPKVVITQSPAKKLAGVLANGNPLRAFGEAIRRHMAARPATGGMNDAIWARDLIMLFLFASCPLRPRNMIEVTYTRDNSGHLKRNAAGEWFIEIPSSQLKNGEYQPELVAYVVKSAWPHLERYLRDYRPAFGSSSYLFASRRDDSGPWESLSTRFSEITGRHLEGCNGAGARMARYLVATGLARRNEISGAAIALHDTKKVVDEFYVLDNPRKVAEMIDQLLGLS